MNTPMIEQPKNHSVWQRQAGDSARVPVVVRDADGIRKLSWRRLPANTSATASDAPSWEPLEFRREVSALHASLTLPAGGWHRLVFRAEDARGDCSELTVEPVGVGEVFLTAGQSNSANWGEPRQRTATGMAVVFDGETWQPAVDPLPVCDGTEGSIWPLVGDQLARELGVPVGFLCLGVGGTAIDQWAPENFHHRVEGKQHYGRFGKFVPRLAPHGFRAVLWHQGETDRRTAEEPYYQGLRALIEAFRKDFGHQPWMIATVGNSWMEPDSGRGCRAAQRRIIEEKLVLPGPDTDTLGKELRLKDGQSSHFNQQGIEAHAALWCEALRKEFFR